MSIDVQPVDWKSLDPWWTAYAETQSIATGPASPAMFGPEQFADVWDDLDPWWQAHAGRDPVVRGSTSARVLGTEQMTNDWADLDPWWDAYAGVGHETAGEVKELLEKSNEIWKHSDAPFDMDPLAADVAGGRVSRGPLRPAEETEWSQWLAQLLWSSGELVSELFDVNIDQAPSRVVREAHLSEEEGTFRRPDVLVHHADHGVSIEVKLGDDNYRKTAKTAELVEDQHDDMEWSHALLLPASRMSRLRSVVDAPIESRPDGRYQIEWDEPGPVLVVNWRDVTAAIRSLLRRGAAVDDHWAANAYLFCGVAEQQIVNFQPQPVIEDLAEPANVVDAVRPIGKIDALEEQLTYLDERVEL